MAANIEGLFPKAEQIRDVANCLEMCLRAYKEFAVDVGRLYSGIKGERNW